MAELGGWKNDNRVERHDRRGQKGGGQRGNRGESIRSYYRHPIKGGRGSEEQLELSQWFIFTDRNPPFPYLSLFLLVSCAIVRRTR